MNSLLGVLKFRQHSRLFAALLLPMLTIPAAAAGQQQICESLKGAEFAGAKILEANFFSEEAPVVYPPERGGFSVTAPPHCLVRGETPERRGEDGNRYALHFEVRLPMRWNGKLLIQGGGGLNGFLLPALGLQGPPGPGAMPSALTRGYGVASSDGGHREADLPTPGAFGTDRQAMADYAHESVRTTTRIARAIVERYFPAEMRQVYFDGCSTGGREGMIAAQRYPELFDGIIAGAPAFHLTGAMIAEAYTTTTLARIAPEGRNQKPDIATALTNADLQLVAQAALSACDGADGLADGLIHNPRACHVNLRSLGCDAASGTQCLTPEKAEALAKIFEGPRTQAGANLYATWPVDAGIAAPNWRQWILGTESMPSINELIAPEAINGVALAYTAPRIDLYSFDVDRDAPRIQRVAAQLDATATDYRQLIRNNTRLLMYTGMSDPVFSADALVAHYEQASRKTGSAEKLGRNVRLFLVPGMNHCAGGPALDRFDKLTALENWVERGAAPARLVAEGQAFPGRSRPLCPYPSFARYAGKGSVESADSFECVSPSSDRGLRE